MTRDAMQARTACVLCEQAFAFNPHYVPTVRADGALRPLCGVCVAMVNAHRRQTGRPLLVPHPEAYTALPPADWVTAVIAAGFVDDADEDA